MENRLHQPAPDVATGASVGTGWPDGASGSTDPFVERRKEIAEAKAAYKSGKISKREYEEARKKADEKLKASGVRGDFEKNLDCLP